MWLYVLIAVLLLVAIAVQVLYVRQYAAQVTGATKAVMYVNIGLLTVLLIAVVVMALMKAGG